METQDIAKTAETVENTAEVKNAVAKESQDGSHFEHVKETLDLLYKYFPKAFIKEGNCRPLKIGIFDDLKAAVPSYEGLSISKVRAALRLYTTRLRYLYCLKEGAARIDLEGNEVEVVSAEHAQFALDRFKEINSKRKVNTRAKNGPAKAEKPAFKKKTNFKKERPAPKIPGTKATLGDLTSGRQVLVLSSSRHYVRGTIADDAQKENAISVTLLSGMTITCQLDRILLPVDQK